MTWTDQEKKLLTDMYPRNGKVFCAKKLNRGVAQVRSKVARMGLRLERNTPFFNDFQKRAAISKIGKKRPEHAKFMRELRRIKPVVHTKDGLKKIGQSSRDRIALNGHPRGMLGKHHCKRVKKIISIAQKGRAHKPVSQKTRNKLSENMINRLKNGFNCYSHAKRGYYEHDGKRHFMRSGWELTYASYLDFLFRKKQIKKWEYEPDTFWFEKIRRGTRSYLPDFKIFNNNGTIEYHEVKGYMDSKSKTKIRRMKKYYPHIKLLIIGKEEYKAVEKWIKLF